MVNSVVCVITFLRGYCFAAVFFVGLAEMGLEIVHCLLARWLGSPFLTYDGEEVVLLNDEGACTDGGGDGDEVSAFGGKLHAGLELFEGIVDGVGGEGTKVCSYALCWRQVGCR